MLSQDVIYAFFVIISTTILSINCTQNGTSIQEETIDINAIVIPDLPVIDDRGIEEFDLLTNPKNAESTTKKIISEREEDQEKGEMSSKTELIENKNGTNLEVVNETELVKETEFLNKTESFNKNESLNNAELLSKNEFLTNNELLNQTQNISQKIDTQPPSVIEPEMLPEVSAATEDVTNATFEIPEVVDDDLKESNISIHDGNEAKLEVTESTNDLQPSITEDSLNINRSSEESDFHRCTTPLVNTTCRNSYPRYFYNSISRKCLFLTYIPSQIWDEGFDTWTECRNLCYERKKIDHRSNLTLNFNEDGFLHYDIKDIEKSDHIDIQFELRTAALDGDILSIIQKSNEKKDVQIYLRMESGKFRVVVTCLGDTKISSFLNIGGLQERAWFTFWIKLDLQSGSMTLIQNGQVQDFYCQCLENMNTENGQTLFIGGIPEINVTAATRIRQKGFIGEISSLSVTMGKKKITWEEIMETGSMSTTIQISQTTQREKSRCLPNYSLLEEERNYDKILSLSGHDFIVYQKLNRKHYGLQTFISSFSFTFKTSVRDQILLYTVGEGIKNLSEGIQFLSFTLNTEGKLHFEVNLGGETVATKLIGNWTNNDWHKVTLIHQHEQITIDIDGKQFKKLEIYTDNNNHFFHLNPELYIGGVPNLFKDCSLTADPGNMEGTECNQSLTRYFYDVHEGNCKNFTFNGCGGNLNNFDNPLQCLTQCQTPGLRSYNFFVGCIKDVFYNQEDVLQSIDMDNYVGTFHELPLSNYCQIYNDYPFEVSFTTEDSHLKLSRTPTKRTYFELSIQFHLQESLGVLASGYVHMQESNYQWEIRSEADNIRFTIPVGHADLTVDKKQISDTWQKIHLISDGQNLTLRTFGQEDSTIVKAPLIFADEIEIGIGNSGELFGWSKFIQLVHTSKGFVGCIRELIIDNRVIDFRYLVGSSAATDDVILDGCKGSNPCQWRGSCGKKSSCSVIDHRPACDCSHRDSVREGPDCLICKYRQSCSDYRELGFEKSGPYIIDMEGNGETQHVNCLFEANDQTSTVVEHNLPNQYKLRNIELYSYNVNVKYRSFNEEMLRELIRRSPSCSQKMTFTCTGFHLSWAQNFWYTALNKKLIGSLESGIQGACPCYDAQTCRSPTVKCNCNMVDYEQSVDSAILTNLDHLPMTSLTMLHIDDQTDESTAELQLGSLICKDQDVRGIEISFSSESFLEVPVWTEGDLVFHFRTTSSNGSIFQQYFSPKYPAMAINMISDQSIEINISYKGEIRSLTFSSRYKINSGNWNLIWIDVSRHVFRVVLNEQMKFLALDKSFDKSLFQGNANFGKVRHNFWNFSSDGFIGCIKQFSINGGRQDLSNLLQYFDQFNVHKDCISGCDKSPCKNQATCVELWNSKYKCICSNPYSEMGTNCERNFNEQAITFSSRDSEVTYYKDKLINLNMNPINENFTFNIRTSLSQAMLLVAIDNIQNLVQVYINTSTEIIFLFNNKSNLIQCSVDTIDTALNEGQSVQIIVSRFVSSTTLSIFTRNRLFTTTVQHGISLLEEDDYEQFPYEVLSHLVSYTYQHSLTLPAKYISMFLGGVQSSGFSSDLPGFIGCLRGLKIGNSLFNMSDDEHWTIGKDVDMGCTSLCEGSKNICKHGGHCINGFQKDTTQHCDCTSTSYMGATCSEETSYHFNGRDSIGLKNKRFTYTDEFQIHFSFSPSGSNIKKQQLIFKISLENYVTNTSRTITFSLKDNNNLNIIEEQSDRQRISSIIPLENTVLRHFVRYSFTEGTNSSLILDNVEITGPLVNIGASEQELFSNFHMLIGGSLSDFQMENFIGCISNIHVETHDTIYYPLEAYKSGEQFERKGLPKFGNCKANEANRATSVFYDFSQIPKWSMPEPERIPTNAVFDTYPLFIDEPVNVIVSNFINETRFSNETDIYSPPMSVKIWPWALLVCLILFACLLGLVCCLKKCMKKDTSLKYDVETKPTVPLSTNNPPPYSVHTTQAEAFPLLEREPSVIRYPRNTRNMVKDVPQTSGDSNQNGQISPGLLTNANEASSSSFSSIAEQDQLTTSPANLNKINENTNLHIPFTNQLSTDMNNLHFIDSSTDGSVEEFQPASEFARQSYTSSSTTPGFQSAVESPKLLNSSENIFTFVDSSQQSNFLVTNLDEARARIDRSIKNSSLSRNNSKDNSKVPLANAEEIDLSSSEDSSYTSDEGDQAVTRRDGMAKKSQIIPPRHIDMKTYYLKRKASEPPKLPPRARR